MSKTIEERLRVLEDRDWHPSRDRFIRAVPVRG
jgi:hypothetical protein